MGRPLVDDAIATCLEKIDNAAAVIEVIQCTYGIDGFEAKEPTIMDALSSAKDSLHLAVQTLNELT